MAMDLSALPVELVGEEILSKLDTVSSMAASFVSKRFHALIDSKRKRIAHTPIFQEWSVIFAEDKWDHLEIGAFHQGVFVLWLCLDQGHPDDLYRFFVVYGALKSRFSYKDMKMSAQMLIVKNRWSLLDWFLALGGETFLSYNKNGPNDEFAITFSICLGASGNVELLRKYAKESEEAEDDVHNTLIHSAMAAAQYGHVAILEMPEVLAVMQFDERNGNGTCYKLCFRRAAIAGRKIHLRFVLCASN